MTPEEWERRFKARIVERLIAQTVEIWSPEDAVKAAQDEFEIAKTEYVVDGLRIGFEDNPEDCADECLRDWEDE